MKKIISLLLLSGLLVLSGCATSGSDDLKNSGVNANQSDQVFDLNDLTYAFIEDEIKSVLRNPASLQINDMQIDTNQIVEDNEKLYYSVTVDYSAQNGFGGYNREETEFYICISKNNNNIARINESEYKNKVVDFINLINNEQYGDKLRTIDSSFPFDILFSSKTYDDVLREVESKGSKYGISENKDGVKEIEYINSFGEYEGSTTIAFYPNNHCFWNMSYFWTESQMSYIDGEIIYSGVGQSATSNNITQIIDLITSALSIEHDEIESIYEPFFDTYSCVWSINESATVKMRWSICQETEEVSSFNIYFTNLINESMS